MNTKSCSIISPKTTGSARSPAAWEVLRLPPESRLPISSWWLRGRRERAGSQDRTGCRGQPGRRGGRELGQRLRSGCRLGCLAGKKKQTTQQTMPSRSACQPACDLTMLIFDQTDTFPASILIFAWSGFSNSKRISPHYKNNTKTKPRDVRRTSQLTRWIPHSPRSLWLLIPADAS